MSCLSLIPQPSAIQTRDGNLTLTPSTTITFQGPQAADVAELLGDYLETALGAKLAVSESAQRGTIHLLQTADDAPDDAGFCDETYALEISEAGALLTAASSWGLARGVQTLRQLLPPAAMAGPVDGDVCLPACEINDTPRFRWRGQHLDVCRHFFTVAEVCRFIDLLALHRMNTCHIHLTEDQGWRIEIKQYPKLTEIGSKRSCTLIGHEKARPRRYDTTPYGGFFTQDDLREIVAFAQRRRVTIVPEIDMPGHMVAAIAAYPELGNNPEIQAEVRCHWGISRQVLNVEKSTVDFMKNVLDEVIDLFPSRFIHIGGDEAPKFEWSESRRAQDRMAELGLASEDELQSWFIRQMDEHITAKGRRLVGWDEIIEGGLPENATVMSWRGEKGGITAAQQGHEVVMAPSQKVYFDHYQAEPREDELLAIGGLTTTETVYGYEPIPAELTPEQGDLVLGSQSQHWAEYIPTAEIWESKAYPRNCALAEVLWCQPDKKDYADFLKRLATHRERLAALNVNAHPKP